MKPTDEEKLQVVDAMLKANEQLTAVAESDDKAEMLRALVNGQTVLLTAAAMLLMDGIAPPVKSADPGQLLLFPDVDADDQTTP
jgi:hypothetical protein